jgi:hypothetical protein
MFTRRRLLAAGASAVATGPLLRASVPDYLWQGGRSEERRARLQWVLHSSTVIFKWRSVSGMSKSRHSRRWLTPSRPHTALQHGPTDGELTASILRLTRLD